MEEGYEDFELSIAELEKRIKELEDFTAKTGVDLSAEIDRLRKRCEDHKKVTYMGLKAWQRVQLARNQARPDAADYITMSFENFIELHGDRCFGDDKSIVTGLANLGSHKVLLVAHRKGSTTQERIKYNFGSPHPEGYRKALAKMKMAEKFRLPIVTLVNTPGAYPGIGAEERGQANAIAENLYYMSILRTPIVSVITGEGGSGGALGICLADIIAILENGYLSVISPEGCAAILWRDAQKAPQAAELLSLTPQRLLELGIVDEIIPEPLGAAHRKQHEMADVLKTYLIKYLDKLKVIPLEVLLAKRYEKYRKIGKFIEQEIANISEL